MFQSAESIPNTKPLGGHTDDAGNTNDNRDNLGDSLDKASCLRSAPVCQVSADIHPVPTLCETLWIDTEAKPDVTPGLAKHTVLPTNLAAGVHYE